MEEKLLKIFKLADLLNSKQNNVYAQITYKANDSKSLELAIISKKDLSFIEKCNIQLWENEPTKWNYILTLMESFVGGAKDE